MRLIEASLIGLAAFFLISGFIGVLDDLTGVITSNLNVSSEMELVLDSYPLFLIALPVMIILIILFKRGEGEGGLGE